MKRLMAVFLLGGLCMFGLAGCGKDLPDVKNQSLTRYYESSGGGSCGGSRSVEITTDGDNTILISKYREWYYEDFQVTEVRVNNLVLSQIESVFRKYRMNKWHNKDFSDVFVADGETTSINFTFGNGESIYFSSQYFPKKYSEKLSEIDTIIDEARENGEKIPGLAYAEEREYYGEEIAGLDIDCLKLQVYEYNKKKLFYRFINGTSEEVEVGLRAKIINADTKEIVALSDNDSTITILSKKEDSESIRLEDYLLPGRYILSVDDIECEFEIE